MRLRFLAPLLLSSFVLAQTPPADTAKSTIFASEALHLKYTYPSSFQALPGIADSAVKEERGKMQGTERTVAECVSAPFMAMEADTGMRLLLSLRLDGTCLGKDIPLTSVENLSSSALTNSLARFGTPAVDSTSTYTLAGRNAYTVTGTVDSQQYGMTFYGIATCFLQGKDAVCFELLSNKCTNLPDMMSYPIKFDDTPGEALMAAKFAPGCKAPAPKTTPAK